MEVEEDVDFTNFDFAEPSQKTEPQFRAEAIVQSEVKVAAPDWQSLNQKREQIKKDLAECAKTVTYAEAIDYFTSEPLSSFYADDDPPRQSSIVA